MFFTMSSPTFWLLKLVELLKVVICLGPTQFVAPGLAPMIYCWEYECPNRSARLPPNHWMIKPLHFG